VPDMDMVETPAAMQRVASLAAARPNRLARWDLGV
jgi:putative membrane protein